jgi:hypothetical protein
VVLKPTNAEDALADVELKSSSEDALAVELKSSSPPDAALKFPPDAALESSDLSNGSAE